MKSVPGRPGDLLYASGFQSCPCPNTQPFWRSTFGGRLWSRVPNVSEVTSFGFGAPKTSGGYPAIFIYGYVNRVLGLWRSDDNATTWTFLTGYPNNSLDNVKTVGGDQNTYGTVYVGFSGSGFVYGKLNFLLNRDLNPAANDNRPMGIDSAA